MSQNSDKGFSRKIKAFFYKIRRKRINQNLLTYIIMVVLATLAWFINKSGSTINTQGVCKVEFYGLPPNSILVPGITTSELQINFSSRGMNLLGLHRNMQPMRIDLSKLDIRTFPESDSTLKFITNDDIRTQVESQMPNECHFISLKPDTIKLDFGVSLRKKVPVVLSHDLAFAKQYRLKSEPVLSPDSVVITGSATIMDSITSISTETLELNEINESSIHKVRLQMPNGVRCPLTLAEVRLEVEKFTESIIEVPLRQLNVPDSINLRIFSQNATIKFNIGWDNYQKVTREMFVLAVDYNDLLGIKRPKTLPVKITKMPEDKGVTNISITPQSVEYLIETVKTKD